jgi:hypothetical protein
MKELFLPIAAMIFIATNISCGPAGYFSTPNEVRNIPSTVYLKDGEVIEGKLHVNSNLWGKQSVKIHKEPDNEVVMLDIENLKGYKSHNSFYDLKEISTGVGKGYHHKFMKDLRLLIVAFTFTNMLQRLICLIKINLVKKFQKNTTFNFPMKKATSCGV